MGLKESEFQMVYPKSRREYSAGFVEAYSQDPMKSRMIEKFGQKYYDAVMDIYKERLAKDDFMIGPQSVEEWEAFRQKIGL